MSSATALELSNRVVFRKIGTQYFDRPLNARFKPLPFLCIDITYSPEQMEKGHFSELLDRDLPNLINCYYCKKLHLSQDTGKDSIKRVAEGHACTEVESAYSHLPYVFSEIQRVMKRHRMGQLSALSKRWAEYDDARPNFRRTNLARPASGHLLMHTQHHFRVPDLNSRSFLRHYDLNLCSHVKAYSKKAFGYCHHKTESNYLDQKGKEEE